MQRQRQITTNEYQGQERFDTFKKVVGRYHSAMKSGFYLEAVTLMESIIGDRFECYLMRNDKECNYSFSTLGRLINGLKKVNPDSDLAVRLDDWKNKRNTLLHEMAKIEDNNYITFEDKYSEAQQCAEEGLALFRDVDKLCR